MTVNEQWFDALLRHQIFLLGGTSNAMYEEINALLNATEHDIAAMIRESLRAGNLSLRMKAAKVLMKAIRKIRFAAWDKADKAWIDSLNTLAKHEGAFNKGVIEAIIPVVINTKLPTAGQLKALVTDKPFQGDTMKGWAKKVRQSDLRRIEEQIKIGVVQGEGSQTIARRIVGTARFKGRDGVMQITRRNAEAITRTAVSHFSDAARGEFFQENSALFDFELFVATLDDRTTPICRSLDGNRYPVGQGPRPPIHWNCRSLRVASIGQEAIGMRPAKPVTQRGLLREFTGQRGFKSVTTRKALPYGSKGQFDTFARRRIREMTGRVPAKTTYQEWLTRQSAEFQDDVLGIARGKLFRKGGLTLDRFVNPSGRQIPLADLAIKEKAAFKAAGLEIK